MLFRLLGNFGRKKYLQLKRKTSVLSIIEDKEIPIKIEKDFKNKTVQTAEEINAEIKKEKQEYLDFAATYYAEDLKASRENDKNEIQKVLSADEKPKDLKIDDKPNMEDILIDDNFLSIDEDIGEDEKEFMHDLINRTDFSHFGEIDFDKLSQWT